MLDFIVAHKRPSNKPFVARGGHAARAARARLRRCSGLLDGATAAAALNQSGRGDGHHLGCCAETVALVYRPRRKGMGV